MTRMHITREGDLEVYSLALDKVPTRWREDPSWSPFTQAPTFGAKSHASQHPRASKLLSQQTPAPYAHDMPMPSRWCPAHGVLNEGWYLVDYFKVCKQRAL
ncbi:hypothetical protein DUNSADRAFT_8225 [Dunaliella salina]|uniref:Encoded protein n=1 Tax=Dunaliella salina TaxID=3046 RepID=A0ABQ7HA28_DUNSA|nr:hypothetical protein DUNSADRAFT_8225 [Dunaliella salina]|eukprot:KAF5843710.1 hypothetical protein DUNSADRAFT_8225 [Dunaliella salina]